MKIKLFIFVLVLMGSLFAIYLLRLIPDKPVKTNYNQTFLLMAYVLDDFDATGMDDLEMQRLVTVLKSQTNSININQKLAAFLTSKTNNIRSLRDFDLTGGVFHDAWGSPLLFALTNAVKSSNLIWSVNASHPRPFVVWSAGPNHSNEWGACDDLVPAR